MHKAKIEEEARTAAEAKAQRQKEEEERKKREAEEEAERQRQLEEERRIAAEQAKAEAQAKAQREAEEQERQQKDAEEAEKNKAADANEAATSADTTVTTASAITSDAGEATNDTDARSVSPHPSFNSLQARPTPPATSGLPSPTSSHPPSSIKSGHRPDTPPRPSSKDGPASSSTVVEILATDATPTGSVVDESPLNLAAARERERLGSTLPQRSLSASSAARLNSLTDESTMFGGAVRKSSLSSQSYLDTASAAASRHANDDSEDDGYGQPSPRNTQVAFPQNSDPGSPTRAPRGPSDANAPLTGSVASLASSTPSRPSADGERSSNGVSATAAPTQPRLYHRPSFDLLQDARDREAYDRLHRRAHNFTIKVGDPQRIGDPMTAHIVYTVRTTTDNPSFRSSQFSSLRRYRDFRWLHAALVQNNPGIIVPPVPEKVSIGRFAAELVEARRIGLETCINKIANHPLLQQDDDFRLFLESENFAADVKQRDAIKGPIVTPEQKTYKSWGSALLGAVVPSTSSLSSGALSTASFTETDPWFDEQRVYLDSLESALKSMVKSVSALSTQRKHLVQATHDLSQVLTTLSGSSLSRSLSTCFAGLAEVKRRAMQLEDLQAEADVRQLGTTMYEYERVVGSVRKAFTVRTEIWARRARANDELRRTRGRFDKYKSANPSSAGPQFQSLLAEVTEAETKALDADRLFNTVGERCKDEMERLDLERVLDFKRVVGEWLVDMIGRQEEVVEEWVRYAELLGRQTGVQILPRVDGEKREEEGRGSLEGSQSHTSNVVVPSVAEDATAQSCEDGVERTKAGEAAEDGKDANVETGASSAPVDGAVTTDSTSKAEDTSPTTPAETTSKAEDTSSGTTAPVERKADEAESTQPNGTPTATDAVPTTLSSDDS